MRGDTIDWVSLFPYGKTLSQLIFNDYSEKTSYICWVTLYRDPENVSDYATNEFRVPNTFQKVLFVGDINKNNFPDQLTLLRNDSNPSQLLRLATIHLTCAPCYDRISQYKMRDLVWNHIDDKPSLTIFDTDSYPRASHNNVAFFAGLKVKTDQDSKERFLGIGLKPNSHPDGVKNDKENIVRALIRPDGGTSSHGYYEDHGAQDYLTPQAYNSWRSFGTINPGANETQSQYALLGGGSTVTVWNCPINSFRNGWFGVSLKTICERVALFAGCDPTNLCTFDHTITGGNAVFNNTNNGYDCKESSRTLDMDFITNYNIIFGVDPRGMGIIKTELSGETNSNGAVRVTVYFMKDANDSGYAYNQNELFADKNQNGLTDGQEVLIEGNSDESINGIWSVGNVSTYIMGDPIPGVINTGLIVKKWWRQDFDLVDSKWNKSTGLGRGNTPNGTASMLMTTPVTYTSNDSFDAFVRDVLWQFIFKLNFPITQNGEYIGMPTMAYTSRWKQGNGLPQGWSAGTKFNRQPRKIASDCIKVTQRGDSGYLLCPPNGKQPPIEIPPLRWRTHQYGTRNGVYAPNLVFDAPNGKGLLEQSSVAYGYDITKDNSSGYAKVFSASISEPLGWIPGAYLYEKYIDAPHSNPRYPSAWNNWCDMNAPFPSSDWSGHYALQALVWHGSVKADGTIYATPSQFNSMYDVIRQAELEFVSNKEMYVRDFLGLVYTDDPDAEYEDKWQEGGEQVYYRMGNRSYNFLIGCLTSSEWQASPIDKNGELSYDSLDNASLVSFHDGATSGSGGAQTSNTGSSSTTNSITTWNDTFRVTTRKVELYSAGTVRKTFNSVAVFETFDAVNNQWVAQYGFVPQYEPDASSAYGTNSMILFHYKGTEKGNCFITGLSGTTPDYWFTAVNSSKHGSSLGTDNSSVDYSLANSFWSEDNADFLVQRPLESPNVNRRLYVEGRFKVARSAGNFATFTWETLSTNFPFSDKECYTDIDKGFLATSAVAPTLSGGNNFIDITWGSRYKPVGIEAKGWGFNLVNNNQQWQVGTNPVSNGAGGNPNKCRFTWWLNNWLAAAGTQHLLTAAATDLDGMPQLDYFIVTFWGLLEVIGENAVTS